MKSFFTLLLGLVAISSSLAVPVEVGPIERQYLGTWQRDALDQEVAAMTIAEDRYGTFLQVWVSQYSLESGMPVMQDFGKAYLQRKKSEGEVPYYEASFPKVVIRLVISEYRGLMAVRVFGQSALVPYGQDELPNQDITVMPGTFTFEKSDRVAANSNRRISTYNQPYVPSSVRSVPVTSSPEMDYRNFNSQPTTTSDFLPGSTSSFSMPVNQSPSLSLPSPPSTPIPSPGYNQYERTSSQSFYPRPGERTYTTPAPYYNRRQGILQFVNTTNSTVEIAKLESFSDARTYQRLYPGQQYKQATYEEDAWVVTRVHDKKELAIINGSGYDRTVDIAQESNPVGFADSGLDTGDMVPVSQLLSVVLKVVNFSTHDVILYTKDDVNQERMVKLIRPEDIYAVDSSVGQEWFLKDAVTRDHLKSFITSSDRDQVLRYD
ncbi:MAG: hypothetical protein AAF388_05015 [Bacteroidota bacterium]